MITTDGFSKQLMNSEKALELTVMISNIDIPSYIPYKQWYDYCKRIQERQNEKVGDSI